MPDPLETNPPRTRRAVLSTVATTAGLLLAGCIQEYDEGYQERPEPVEEHVPTADILPDLPVREFSDEYEAGIRAGLETSAVDLDSFGAVLEDEGMGVEHLEREHEYLYLTFVADSPQTGILRNVGFVAGAYVPFVLAADDPPTLDGTILEREGVDFGSFTVYVNWVRAFGAGDEGVEVYGERVFQTLKTKR